MTEVLEITCRELSLAKSVVNSSVMPSTKYSCDGSPEKLSSGSTAIERKGSRELAECERDVTIQEIDAIAARINAPNVKTALPFFQCSRFCDSTAGWAGSV